MTVSILDTPVLTTALICVYSRGRFPASTLKTQAQYVYTIMQYVKEPEVAQMYVSYV